MTTAVDESPNAQIEPKVQLLVMLIASRCNLDCSYCYVYHAGDESWRSQPHVMSPEVVQALLDRVRSHCDRHGMTTFGFVFHGGEPLLVGMDWFRHFVATARRTLGPKIEPIFMLQTNGTLLTSEWGDLFAELKFSVGVSIDGPKEFHDRVRVDHAGRGSYDQVLRGLASIRQDGKTDLKPGILTVVDLDLDPIVAYEHHRALGVHGVDFIVPFGTRDKPPRGLEGGGTPYADWLIRLFDRWYFDYPQPMTIRMFEHYMRLLLGEPTTLDTMGTTPNEVLAIQADGAITPIGTLAYCGPEFTRLGANVLTETLDQALDTDLARQYHWSGQRRCDTCQKCPIGEICGGGNLPWRYSRVGGFDNPAVYCRDLAKLITHIQRRMADSLPQSLKSRLPLRDWSYEMVQAVLPPETRRPNPLRVL